MSACSACSHTMAIQPSSFRNKTFKRVSYRIDRYLCIRHILTYHKCSAGGHIIVARGVGIVGHNSKNPPKNKVKKSVKLTDHTCHCNNLTNLQWPETKIWWKSSWNPIKRSYFWRVLAVWNHCVVAGGNLTVKSRTWFFIGCWLELVLAI